jgi:nucleotidyltransferase/DNA polymerase involved in DNA repair
MVQEFFNAEAESFSIRSYATPPRKEVNQLTESKKQYPHDLYAGRPVAKMESRKQVVSGKTLNYIIREIYDRDLEDYHLDETKLVFGAIIAQALIVLIEQRTGYYASVGGGHSKLSAKLACDRNKPQGITIILDAAIPRLSREIEFQELPGFKGAIGKKLREEYKRDTGKELTTLQDVQRIGLNRTMKLFKKIKVPNPEILTIDLINKSYLRDEEPVHTRYYSDTVGLSMPLEGRHAVRSRADFMERIASLSRLFIGRLKYRFDTHRILAAQCSVKAELKQNVNKQEEKREKQNENNSKELKQLPNKEEIYSFVMNYIESNDYDVFAIVGISLRASKF